MGRRRLGDREAGSKMLDWKSMERRRCRKMGLAYGGWEKKRSPCVATYHVLMSVIQAGFIEAG
jgi:hypothetical protein